MLATLHDSYSALGIEGGVSDRNVGGSAGLEMPAVAVNYHPISLGLDIRRGQGYEFVRVLIML